MRQSARSEQTFNASCLHISGLSFTDMMMNDIASMQFDLSSYYCLVSHLMTSKMFIKPGINLS